MLTRTLLLASSLAAGLFTSSVGPTDRRVVDTVSAGDAESEADHGYAGHEDFTGVTNHKTFRQARGWMRYAMTTFDDTQVTIACTFVRTANTPLTYDVIVEDSLVATRTFTATSALPVVVEIAVPLSVTKGRTNIAVFIRGRGGLTPALRELRTIQDHYEVSSGGRTEQLAEAERVSRFAVEAHSTPATVAAHTARLAVAVSPSRSHPLGVAR